MSAFDKLAPTERPKRAKCGKPALGYTCVRDPEHEGVCYPAAVMSGKLMYLSVSGVEAYDSAGMYGCNRKWGFRYLDRIRFEDDTARRTGVAEHAALAHYALTGEDVLTPISRAGKHFVYGPGPRLAVEHESIGIVSLAAVPFLVKLDVANFRDYWLDDDGERRDLAVPEVNDWKTTGEIKKKAKTPRELLRTVQMPVYGEWAMQVGGERKGARLSHSYFGTKKREAKKVSLLATAVELESRLEEVAHLVERMKGDATATTGALLAPNWNACRPTEHGKPCEYINICPRDPARELVQIGVRVDRLLRDRGGEEIMSASNDLMSMLNAKANPAPAAASAAPPPAAVSAASYTQADLDAAVARRMAELESANKTPPPTAPPVMVTGPAANVLVADAPIGAGVMVAAAVADAAQSVAQSLGLLPPDAPKSGQSGPAATPIPPEQLATMSPAIQAAAAAVAAMSAPVEPATAPIPTPGGVIVGEEKPARKPRTPKAAPSGIGTSPSVPNPGGIIIQDGFTLLVDAVVQGVDATPLEPYVDALLKRIADANNRGIDVRCADGDSPLAYGKWKGVLAVFAKDEPPPPGVYTLHVEGSEARQTVAEALRPLAACYVKGVRS